MPTLPETPAPISVRSAIVGLLAATRRAHLEALELAVGPDSRVAPLRVVAKELFHLHFVVLQLQKQLRRVELGTAPMGRAALLDLDTLITVLTATVMTVSEMQRRLGDLVRTAQQMKASPAEVCDSFAEPLAMDVNRVGIVLHVIDNLICALQTDDEDGVLRLAARAREYVMDILQSDNFIAARVAHLEDAFGARSRVAPGRLEELARRPPPDYSVPPASGEPLPDYSEASSAPVNADGSITIRPHNWSIFSGLTLADVDVMSVIPLPLVYSDIAGGDLYAPGYADSVDPLLDNPSGGSAESRSRTLPEISSGDVTGGGGQAGFVCRLAIRSGSSRSITPTPQ